MLDLNTVQIRSGEATNLLEIYQHKNVLVIIKSFKSPTYYCGHEACINLLEIVFF